MRLIDADALKLSMMMITPGETVKYCYPCKEVLKAIDDTPTIEPERKKGKLIIEPYDLEHDIWAHRCGECLRVSMLGGKAIKFNFCPNCGEEMEKP